MIHNTYNKVDGIATLEFSWCAKMGRLHRKFDRRWKILAASAGLVLVGTLSLGALPARAAPNFVACGGAAMLGGAQLNCSHLAPKKPAQLCNFSWSLLLPNNVPQVVSGSFLLPQGANNAPVYQGTGYVGSLSAPIILCTGER